MTKDKIEYAFETMDYKNKLLDISVINMYVKRTRKFKNSMKPRRWDIISWNYLSSVDRIGLWKIIPELKEKNIYEVWMKIFVNFLCRDEILSKYMFFEFETIIHETDWNKRFIKKLKEYKC